MGKNLSLELSENCISGKNIASKPRNYVGVTRESPSFRTAPFFRYSLFFFFSFLLFSCNKETEKPTVTVDESSYLENFSISGTAGNKPFVLKASEAKVNNDKTVFELKDISFSRIAGLSISSSKGEYFKAENLIRLDKVAGSFEKLNFTAFNSKYWLNNNFLSGANPDINYFNHNLQGSEISFDETKGNIEIKKIKARMQF